MKNRRILLSLAAILGLSLLGFFLCKEWRNQPITQANHGTANINLLYNADQEVAIALSQLKTSQDKAPVIRRRNTKQRMLAVTFDGLTDKAVMQQILDVLKKEDIKVTFFVDGVQAAEEPQVLQMMKKDGHEVESYTLAGMRKMESLPLEKLVTDFSRAKKIIKVNTDGEAQFVKCNDTKYTDAVLQAAIASGFSGVVRSDVVLNLAELNSAGAADTLISTLKPGSIVSIKLKTNADEIVNQPGKTDLQPALDKQPGLKELKQSKPSKEMEGQQVAARVEQFLLALKRAKYRTVCVEELANLNNSLQTSLQDGRNNIASLGHTFYSWVKELDIFGCRKAYAADAVNGKAELINTVSTTEPVVAYSFSGLANEAAVNDILSKLNTLGIKGTFFLFEVELKRYPGLVHKIIDNGHEIGLAIRLDKEETFADICQKIIRGRTMLKEQFGVAVNLVKQPYGTVSDTTKEAAKATDCYLIGQSMNIVQSKHKDYSSVEAVMAEVFRKSMISLARGQILHFRMDYYTNERLVGDLVEAVKQQKLDNIAYKTFYDNPSNNAANNSQYRIKTIGEMLNNNQLRYDIPAESAKIPPALREDYRAIQITEHNFIREASKRYIGNMAVNYEDRMIGFSKWEERRLDKEGFIHTEENVIFLTFDDWGSDAAINKLLYVLRKHHVPATFFILTNNVLNNANLLRAIAVEGHDIAGHTDKHKPMAVRDSKTGKQIATQNKEEYLKDLATAYHKLQVVTGDVTVNTRPALTRFFRPPTLAISKMGFEALFNTGYEYIINGSYSTEDYAARSYTELIRNLENGVYTPEGGVQKGAILTMHMSDAAVYTAVALDILLSANQAKADSDPSKFRVGRLAQYIPQGYSQMERAKAIKLNSPIILNTVKK